MKRVNLSHTVKNAVATIWDVFGINGRYYKFGINDDLPNKMIEAVNDSGTARRAVGRLQEFIYGTGLPKEVSEIKVNSLGQTIDGLLDQVSRMVAYTSGFCIQVLYNNEGLPARYYSIPIQNIRKRRDGYFIYAENYGDEQFSLFSRGKFDGVPVPPMGTFNTPDKIKLMVREQIKRHGKQLGQFLYVYTPSVGAFYDIYPIPDYFSGIDDIKADAALSRRAYREVLSGQMDGVIIATGEINDTVVADEDGKTALARFYDDLDAMTGEDAAPMLHIMSSTDGDKATISRLDPEKQAKAAETRRESIAKIVCRHVGVPPILIGIETPGKLGNSQELVNTIKLFNLVVQREQLKIEAAFKVLFPELSDKMKIEPLRLFDHVPDNIMEILSEEEKRELYDLPPKSTLQ